MRRNRSSASSFKPAWWCGNPHLQTVWPSFARPTPRPNYRREVLDLPDGDFIDIDWLDGPADGPLIVLIHGLCGSSRSPYIRGLAVRFSTLGFTVAAMNLRSAGGRPNRRPRTYHSGQTDDLDFLIRDLARRAPDRAIFCAGFSLGGNLLLKWLGENPHANPVRACVAVSVPFLLDEAALRMRSGFSRVYQNFLLGKLKRSTGQRRRLLEGRVDFDRSMRSRDFFEFDDAVTAPVNGFSDARNYYERCSSRRFLRRITVPTLLIQSRDDPFMTARIIPAATELADPVTLEVHERGGHVGFISGPSPGFSRYWLEERIPRFLDAFR
jgi:predicted alpha/beta-fold hydrolase